MKPVDYSAEAVDARLREVSRLRSEALLKPRSIDYSPEAVTRRLQEMSRLRTFCLKLGQLGRAAGLHEDPR